MAEFAIHKKFDNEPDIQRNYMFDLSIPDMAKYGIQEDILTVRCRNLSLPGRGSEPIESTFMGMKQWFPGKPTFPGTLSIMFEEFEDRKVSLALYNWQQDVFDVHEAGAALVTSKAEIAKTMTIRMYDYKGDLLTAGGEIEVINSWPQDIGDVALDYTGNESVKITAVFQYDRWLLK